MNKSRLVDKIGSFTTIPNDVIRLIPDLGTEAFTLFCYLRFRTNNESLTAFPGYATIQRDTGLHPRKIVAAIRKLESLGILNRKKRFGKTTIYTLQPPDKQYYKTVSSSTVGSNEARSSSSTVGSISSSTVGSDSSSNGWKRNNTKNNKIDSNKIESEPAAYAAGPARDTQLYDSAKALATVCKMDFDKNRGRLFAEAKRLGEPASEIIERFGPGRWWYADDWRGQRGEPPTPAQVREVWGQWNLPKSQQIRANGDKSNVERAKRYEYTDEDRALAERINAARAAARASA